MVEIPEQAVQEYKPTINELLNELKCRLESPPEPDLEELRLMCDAAIAALTAAAPYMSSSAREQALDLSVLQRMAEKAEEFDHPDDLGPYPDIQDAMITVGDLRKLRKLLAAIRALKSQPAPEFSSKELVNSFNRGYVIACANIVNMYGAKVEVAEGFAQLSITKSDFEALELCSYDKDAIKTLEEFAGEEKLFVSSDHAPQTGGGE